MDEIVAGIDVGTTKVCTLVGRVEEEAIRILGVGIEPSGGIKKGVIVDLAAASQAIMRSVDRVWFVALAIVASRFLCRPSIQKSERQTFNQ